jgi:hypothetical protein
LVDFSRDSNLLRFIVTYIISEILFFIGTGILIVFKVFFSIDMPEIMQGTFLGPASQGLFTEAFSTSQMNWITNNLVLWPINTFLTFYSSLLLISGFFALAILLPLQIEIFEGPNSIPAEAIPIGFLFLLCWGILPTFYILRSSLINFGSRIRSIFNQSKSKTLT